MESWVYIFSRFTQEALLFEALLMFIGFAAYAAFYITRRRKYGVAGPEIPSNLVKVYLAQLVADAEEMRNQLFGLLGKGQATGKFFNINILQGAATAAETETAAPSTGVTDPKWTNNTTTAAAALNDPAAQQRLRDLENKMKEQAKALDAVLAEKTRLEQELALAKAKGPTPSAEGTSNDSSAERLKTLEAQLAEYAVIEDDLANLKRLQKENKSLRQQLEAAIGPNATATSPAPAAETPAVAAPTPAPAAAEPSAEAAPTPAAAVASAGATAPEPTPDPGVAAAPAADPTQSFDALVDDVEKSLAQTDVAPQTEATAAQSVEDKSEEELQADFEKMLKA